VNLAAPPVDAGDSAQRTNGGTQVGTVRARWAKWWRRAAQELALRQPQRARMKASPVERSPSASVTSLATALLLRLGSRYQSDTRRHLSTVRQTVAPPPLSKRRVQGRAPTSILRSLSNQSRKIEAVGPAVRRSVPPETGGLRQTIWLPALIPAPPVQSPAPLAASLFHTLASCRP
jgi:hypothetical protein